MWLINKVVCRSPLLCEQTMMRLTHLAKWNRNSFPPAKARFFSTRVGKQRSLQALRGQPLVSATSNQLSDPVVRQGRKSLSALFIFVKFKRRNICCKSFCRKFVEHFRWNQSKRVRYLSKLCEKWSTVLRGRKLEMQWRTTPN